MKAKLENVQVWVAQLSKQRSEPWLKVLSEAELIKMRRYHRPADQQRFGVTRGALRALLGQYVDRAPQDIEFVYNENGKLQLAEGGVQFNVSHSGDYGLLAFTESERLGVDVEQIAEDRVVTELAQRVLTPREHSLFSALSQTSRQKAFFEIWTLKEALLKAIGSGLSIAPDLIEVTIPPEAARVLKCPVEGPWTLAQIEIGDAGYAAAVAVGRMGPVTVDVRYLHD